MRKKGEFYRVTITLPKEHVKWIQKKREQGNFNFSEFVQNCINEKAFTHVRIVKITGELNPKGWKIGQMITLLKEEYESLPSTKWGKYIPAEDGVKYYVKEVK